MKQLQTTPYKPAHQIEGQPEVEFDLRPINQRVMMAMLADWRDDLPGPMGVSAAIEHSVVGWRGLPQEFSTTARRELFDGEANLDSALWAYQIAAEAFRRAKLGRDAAKNS